MSAFLESSFACQANLLYAIKCIHKTQYNIVVAIYRSKDSCAPASTLGAKNIPSSVAL